MSVPVSGSGQTLHMFYDFQSPVNNRAVVESMDFLSEFFQNINTWMGGITCSRPQCLRLIMVVYIMHAHAALILSVHKGKNNTFNLMNHFESNRILFDDFSFGFNGR